MRTYIFASKTFQYPVEIPKKPIADWCFALKTRL